MFFHRKSKDRKHSKSAKQEDTVIFEDEPKQTEVPAPADTPAEEPEEIVLEDEILEIEFNEEDIAYYLVDEDDNEVGFVIVDEDGRESEYYYAENEEAEGASDPAKRETPENDNPSLAYKAGAAAAGAAVAGKHAAKAGVEKAKTGVEKARSWADRFQPEEGGEYDLGITREGVKETAQDMNAIYHEGIETITELRDAFDDIKEGFGLDGLLGKKKK